MWNSAQCPVPIPNLFSSQYAWLSQSQMNLLHPANSYTSKTSFDVSYCAYEDIKPIKFIQHKGEAINLPKQKSYVS